jgi:hypothetical protein
VTVNRNDRKELRRNQVIGLLAGLLGGWMAGSFWPVLPAAVGWGGVFLWGGAIGAILGSLPQFERAGKVLTRSDNPLLNMAVGLAIPLIIIGMLAFVLGQVR